MIVKLFLLLFADDAAFFSETPCALQSMLNDLHICFVSWDLKVYTNETKIKIFEKGRKTHLYFTFDNMVLKTVDSFRYLGIILFKNDCWNRTQQHISKHSLYSLHLLCNQLNLSTLEICKRFDSLESPILNYGTEIFGYHPAKEIVTVHGKFLRKTLAVRKTQT